MPHGSLEHGSNVDGSVPRGAVQYGVQENGSVPRCALQHGAQENGSVPRGALQHGAHADVSTPRGAPRDGSPADRLVPGEEPLPGTERPPAADSLAGMVERLALALERSNVLDYTLLLQRPWRMIWINFVGGMARGLGIGIGFTVLSAILLYALRGLMLANLPIIGDLIATIVRLVEQQLRP